jgi:HAD superfamily hydrolase (TIGR01509 family)
VVDSGLVMDFDGTILDTEEPVYRSWAELWSEHGTELSLADWQALIGTGATFDPWSELQRRLGHQLDPWLRERRRSRRDELQARHSIRPGVRDWLEDARRAGVPVGVASSSPEAWVDGHLTRLGLREFFSCVVCANDVIPAKPDPASYRLACDRLGSDPMLSVAVEDSPPGVAAAVAAGMYTVAVPHGLTANLDLSAAHLTVESLETLTLREAIARAGAPRTRW